MAGTKISLYTLTVLKPFEVVELGVEYLTARIFALKLLYIIFVT